MKTFIANFITPGLAWITVCVIAGMPEPLPLGTRIALPVFLTMLAWAFSRLHDSLTRP